MILFNAAIAVLVMLVLYAVKPFVLHWIFGKVDASVMQHAQTYLFYVAASIPFMAVYIAGAAIFRTMGNSMVSMKVAALMNAINLGGSALFLFGLHWGTAGVGLAALLARAFAAIAIVVWPIAYTLPVTFRAAGDARFSMGVGIATMFGCRVLMAHILVSFFHLGLLGTWFAMFLDWIARGLVFSYRYLNGRWMRYHAI